MALLQRLSAPEPPGPPHGDLRPCEVKAHCCLRPRLGLPCQLQTDFDDYAPARDNPNVHVNLDLPGLVQTYLGVFATLPGQRKIMSSLPSSSSPPHPLSLPPSPPTVGFAQSDLPTPAAGSLRISPRPQMEGGMLREVRGRVPMWF